MPSSQQESCDSFRRALRCRRGSVRGDGDGMHGARLKAGGWCTRTLNMLLMVVTLDVSKLSFWLNADARCRVERRACDAGGGADREAGERGEVAAQAACTGKARLKAWGLGHARSARQRSRSDRYLGQRGSAESPCMTGPLGGLKVLLVLLSSPTLSRYIYGKKVTNTNHRPTQVVPWGSLTQFHTHEDVRRHPCRRAQLSPGIDWLP